MSVLSPAVAPRQAWIVSPAWDLTYLVATPLAIVPAVLLLSQYWFTPEQITLAVISFASMGHHLPGFMRAYGDRELFAQFRLRFLVVPPLIFALALLFSPPSWLAGPLGIRWQHLHGLELILLLWGTWHGLMQTYGFMRIYDLKRGLRDRWTARLDHWLCLSIFGCGYLFSDARMYGTAEVMWQIGLPVFDRGALQAVRTAAAIAAAIVVVLYIAHAWRQERQGDGVSWNKVLLAASTGWIYWYTGRLSTNLLIGLAMFEIYHAIQYYAIVWFYNRRIVERDGNRFGWLAFLFRDRWTMLGLYLALIAAFGSIRFFTVDTADYVFRGGELDAHKLLIAFLVTSTFLHYYFDGFIWKVSEGRTQRNLIDEANAQSIPTRIVPGLVHAAKWCIFFAAAGLFLWSEHAAGGRGKARSFLHELAALTPELPELQIQLSRDALERGNIELAIQSAQSALTRRPRSHSAYGDLAVSYMAAGKYDQAVPLLRTAAALEPSGWRYHTNLGLAFEELSQPESAERAFHRAVSLKPRDPMPYERLGTWLLKHGRPAEAATQLAQAIEQGGDAFTLRLRLAEAWLQAGQLDRAERLARQLCEKRPMSADAHVVRGTALAAAGQFGDATDSLQRAVELEPNHVAGWFQLGATYYALGQHHGAKEAYLTTIRLSPNHPEALANLGAVLLAAGELAASEARLRQALSLRPDLADARLNLGVCLLRQGWNDAATEQVRRAREAGQPVPEQILREVGLAQGK
jgi:Flp pilus assembly protein TadD